MNERGFWQAWLGGSSAQPTDPFAVIATAPASALRLRLQRLVNPAERTDQSAAELGGWSRRRQAAPAPWTGSWGLFAALCVRVLREPDAYAAWADPTIRAAIWPTQWDTDATATPEGMDEKHLMRWVILGLPGHALSDSLLSALHQRHSEEEWAGFSTTFSTLRNAPDLCSRLHSRWWTHVSRQPNAAHVLRVLREMPAVFCDDPELARHVPDLVDELRAQVRAEQLADRAPDVPTSSRRRS